MHRTLQAAIPQVQTGSATQYTEFLELFSVISKCLEVSIFLLHTEHLGHKYMKWLRVHTRSVRSYTLVTQLAIHWIIWHPWINQINLSFLRKFDKSPHSFWFSLKLLYVFLLKIFLQLWEADLIPFPPSSPPLDLVVPQPGMGRAVCCPPCPDCRVPRFQRLCSSASTFYCHISYMQHTVKVIQDVTWGVLKCFIIKYFKLIMCDS